MKSEMLGKKNNSRKRFVDIGLEHVAVAAARVKKRPPRCSLKVSKTSMSIKRLRESFCSWFGGASSPPLLGPAFNRRGNPNSKLCLGSFVY